MNHFDTQFAAHQSSLFPDSAFLALISFLTLSAVLLGHWYSHLGMRVNVERMATFNLQVARCRCKIYNFSGSIGIAECVAMCVASSFGRESERE